MQILRKLSQWLQIAPQNGIHKHDGIIFRISRRSIHGVRLHDDGLISALGRRWVKCGDGSVVSEAVVATDHTEAQDVVFVVQNLKAFGTAPCGKAGDDVYLPESPHVSIADDHVAALDEVFVGLRVIESPDHRPDGRNGGGDFLDHGGTSLVGPHRIGMVDGHGFRHLRPFVSLFLAMDWIGAVESVY